MYFNYFSLRPLELKYVKNIQVEGHAVLEGLRHDLKLKCYFSLSMCKMVYLRILNVWPKCECVKSSDKRNAEVKKFIVM